ncbi:MAG: FMN-binding protein MioC [Morganella sp. (in: enterobacteria)]|uniref:FMN-binding protein MioC n=1 Tax=Morganella psychrotolerans TaxID=368603 RepID=A0A1B8HSI7_9GAMM|nr:FMN-binding protein MioC [Morganella psychrotolerans]OBU12682.1 FMN-binding protein MioC [Morganella psychrotolerans]
MTTVTLISGSTMGSAEYVAEHVAEILDNSGFTTDIQHGPELNDVPQQNSTWLIVTSTHGAGDLPENIQPFADALREQKPDLSSIRYGAIGIGSSEYDTFCGAIRTLDTLLASLGAQKIGESLEIDIQQHEIPEDPAEIWIKEWINLC